MPLILKNFIQDNIPQDYKEVGIFKIAEQKQLFPEEDEQENNSKEDEQTKQQKYQVLKSLGYASSEQDLSNLQSMARITSKQQRKLEESDEDLTHKKFLKLVTYLSECHLRETWIPAQLPLTLSFLNETDQHTNFRNQIITDLKILLISLRSNQIAETDQMRDKLIEDYFQNSYMAKELMKRKNDNCNYFKQQLQLDIVCQKIAEKTKSVSLLLYFAFLTGNICYILQAINLLLEEPESVNSLKGDEIVCNASKTDFDNQQTKYEPLIVRKVGNVSSILPKNTCLIIESLQTSKFSLIIQKKLAQQLQSQLTCFIQYETKSVDRLQNFDLSNLFNKLRFENLRVERCGLTGQQLKEENWVWGLNAVVQIDSKFTISYYLQEGQLILTIVNSQSQVIQKAESLYLINTELTEFIKQVINERPDFLKLWWEDQKFFVTQIINYEKSSKIITSQLNKDIQFEIEYPSIICEISVLTQQSLGLISIQDEKGVQSFDFINLLSGQTYQTQAQTKVVTVNRTQPTSLLTDFQQPNCPHIQNLTFDSKQTFEWTINGKDETLQLFGVKVNNGKAIWNQDKSDNGYWKYSDNIIFIKRGQTVYKFCFSNDGIDLILLPEKSKKVSLIQPKQINDFVKMEEFHLAKFNPSINCQFSIEGGGGTGQEFPKNLSQEGEQDWNKWCAIDCQNGQSWISIDFKRQVQFQGIGFKMANDEPQRDPKIIQIFVATIEGKWRFVKSIDLTGQKFDRHQTVAFHTGYLNTHAILVHLQNQGGHWQLQLNEILLYKDHQRTKGEFINQVRRPIVKFESVETWDGNFQNQSAVLIQKDLIYAFESVHYPLDQQQVWDEVNENEDRDLEEIFYNQKQTVKKSPVKFSAIGLALYLAQLIDKHSSFQRNKQSLSGIKWLHIYSSKSYFDQVFKLLKKGQQNASLIKILNRNICDNLNTAFSRKLVLEEMYQESEDLLPLIENHLKIEPQAYSFYLYHSSQLKNLLTSGVVDDKLNEQSAFDQNLESNVIEELQKQIKHHHTCINVISGNYEGFVDLLEKELANNRLIEAQALLLSLSASNNFLPIEVVKFLFNQVSNSNSILPINLKKDITNIFLRKVINYYMEAEDVISNQNYDEKGYLITQSELLSGGISNDQIGFFKTESLSQIKDCAILCNDSSIDIVTQNETKDQSNIYLSLIHNGKNSIIDEIIIVLKKQIIKKGGLIALEIKNDSGNGLQIVRAAFAVMVKLNIELQNCLQQVYDTIDLINGEDIPLEKGDERDSIFEQICNEQPEFQKLTKVWNSATKMLLWFRLQRLKVSEKISESKDQKNPEETELLEKAEIDEILKIILEKAYFLIKLQPSKQQENKRIELNLIRKPSYVKQQSNQLKQNELLNVDDSINVAQNENILQASVSSILSCLQAPVVCVDIQNQVENNYRAAVRLYTGLYLLNSLLEQNSSSQFLLNAANCLMNLQKGKNLSHYMDGVIGGCNNNLEVKIRQVMFEILKKLGQSLAQTQSIKEANNYLSVFQWQYQARDFMYLDKLDIFYLLCGKQGNKESLVSQSWASLTSDNKEFSKNLLQTFVEIFAVILARITTLKNETEIDLKIRANQDSSNIVPNLIKAKSQVNEQVSCNLIDRAVRVIFRCFDTFYNQKSQIYRINDMNILQKFRKLKSDEDIIQLIQSILNGEIQVNNTEDYENLELNQIDIELDEEDNSQIETTQINTTSNKAASQKQFDSEFDWSQHFKKDKTSQVMTLPEEQFIQIQLNELETVQSHQHVLRKKQEGDNSGWNCDKLQGSSQCRSGLTGFYQSSKILGWQCRSCNYDLCIACMKVDKSFEINKIYQESRGDDFDWENFFANDKKNQIKLLPKSLYNQVELKENEFVLNHKYLMEKTRPGSRSGWTCDSLYCRSEVRQQGWHSVQSNFDLCQDCMKVEKRIKIQIELIFQMQSNLWRSLDVSTIVAFMPSFLYQDVEVENEELVKSHRHPLTKHVPGGTKRGCFDYNSYSCNKIQDAASCKSGSSCSGIQGWRCYDCQFDFCINCLKVEKLISQPPVEFNISAIFQEDQNQEQLTYCQIKEIKTKISTVFTKFSQDQYLNELINCVKLLSSVSTQSQNSSSILSKIVNPYYMRTLLELLIEVSDQNKFVILSVIDDLIKLNIPLDLADEVQIDATKPKLEIKQLFGSQIADFLFSYAKKCASENQFQSVKIIIKSLQKFDINLKPLLKELSHNETIDQVLLLMLSNCGAEIKSQVIGDEIILLNSNLPIEEMFTLKNIDGKNNALLYNQSLNKFIEKKKSQIQSIKRKSQKPLGLPGQVEIVKIIRSVSTSPIVKLMLINMLIERKTEFDEVIQLVTPDLIKNILDQFEKYSEWQFERKEKKQISFAPDESEFILFQDLFKLISNKIESRLDSQSFDNQIQSDTSNRRSLVKSLFRKQIEQPKNESFERNKIKYYSSLYGIDSQLMLPYFLIGNEAMQNDFLQFYNDVNKFFPINPELENHQNELADKIVNQCDIETIKIIAKQQIPVVEKLNINFKLKFKELLLKETGNENPRKRKQIQVSEADCEVVYLQRSLQLVFQTFDSSKVQEDTDILWHLAQYFIHLKEYNFIKGLQKQGVTKRWVEILQQSPQHFKQLYVSRSIDSLYLDSRKLINVCNKEFKALQLIIAHFKAASRIVLNNFEQLGQYTQAEMLTKV